MWIGTSSYIVLGLEELVREDPLLAKHWPERGSDLKLAWPSPEFDRLLAIVSETDFPLRVSARLSLNEDEERSVSLWEMQLDSFITLSGAEERWRESEWKRLETVPGSVSVRSFRQFRLSKDRIKSKAIVGMQGVVFFPPVLVEEFQKLDFCGATWAPVTDLEAKTEWEGMRLLVPNEAIGPVIRDASVESMIDADGAEILVPRAWSIAYAGEQINEAADFNVTTDPLAGYDLGSIVVSQRVRASIERGNYRGVFFTPVLDAEGKLYSEFLAKWSALSSQVVARKGNRLK